jgi:hypothetical protein
MKLKFEIWTEENPLPENTKNLFITSVNCYKAQAYNASLLMAYLGFLVTLKERVMSAEKPALFPDHLWKNLISNLKNEDKWEESIFDASMQKEKMNGEKPPVRTQDPVFVINDNLRTQIRYWKDRRNDCVHNKDNIITNFHVENFWTFLQSNLQKITIEGGRVTLLNKFSRHYNRSYTAADEDVMPLIKEIKGAVTKVEMHDFWNDLFFRVTDLWDYSNEITLMQKVIQLNDTDISQSLVTFLKSEENYLNAYINEYPAIISMLGYNNQEIRNFWSTKIKKMSNVMGVYASMLRNNLIPQNQIQEANKKIVSLYKYPQSPDDHYVLSSNGFGEVLYEELFIVKNPNQRDYWKFMNKHYVLYTKYLELYHLKEDTVRILCEEFNKEQYKSYFLRDSIDRLFMRNQTKMNEFKQIAENLDLELPTEISSLNI